MEFCTFLKYHKTLKFVSVFFLNDRGENLLFADADGATTFPDLVKLEEAMESLAKDGQVSAINVL